MSIRKEIPKEFLEEINSSETETTEFKKSFKSQEGKIKDTILAFANQRGGRIYIGVIEKEKEDTTHYGEISGLQSSSNEASIGETERLINNWRKDFTSLIPFSFNEYVSGERKIWVIEVKSIRPNIAATRSGLYKIRVQSENVGITPNMMKSFIIKAEEYIRIFKEELVMNKEHLTKIYEMADRGRQYLESSIIFWLMSQQLRTSVITSFLNTPGLNDFFLPNKLGELYRDYVSINLLLEKVSNSVEKDVGTYYKNYFNNVTAEIIAIKNRAVINIDNLIVEADNLSKKISSERFGPYS